MSELNENVWTESNVICVTGFGPFRGFTEKNPSWEAVLRLPDYIEYNEKKLTIEKYNIAVTYEAVDEVVPKLWQKKPLVSMCKHQSITNFQF